MPRPRPPTFCLLGVLLLATVGCGGRNAPDDGRPRLAYVTNGVAAFWLIAEAGARAAARAEDVALTVLMPAEGVTEQKRMLEDLLSRGVDGVAVSPIDPANQVDLLNEVAERAHLVTHDSDAPGSHRVAYVGLDNYAAGRLCGQLVREALPRGGKVALFIGRLEQDNGRRRRQGVVDAVLGRAPDPSRFDPPGRALRGDGYTIVGALTDQFDRARAKANAEDMLARHPDLGAMVGLFAYNTPLVLEALAGAGRLGTIAVVGFDEADETLDGIASGHVHGTVVQDPYQYGLRSIEILAALARGEDPGLPPDGFVDIPARAIRQPGLADFRAELARRLGDG